MPGNKKVTGDIRVTNKIRQVDRDMHPHMEVTKEKSTLFIDVMLPSGGADDPRFGPPTYEAKARVVYGPWFLDDSNRVCARRGSYNVLEKRSPIFLEAARAHNRRVVREEGTQEIVDLLRALSEGDGS